jgi:hypothetical protein
LQRHRRRPDAGRVGGTGGQVHQLPDCSAALAVLRIIRGRADAEYWTMRCTRCGGIHLDIVRASEVAQGSDDLRA